MNFEYSSEQAMLRDTLASFLADRYDFETRRKVIAQGPGWRPEIWRALARDLDLLGAAFPESLGGQGGGAVENAIVMEELGKALVVEPYLGTVVIGGGLLQQAGGTLAAELAPRIIGGEVVLALACAEDGMRDDFTRPRTTATRRGSDYVVEGRKTVVVGAPWATHLVVTARADDGLALLLVDRSARGVALQEYPTIDGSRAATVTLAGVRVPPGRRVGDAATSRALLERVLDEALVALCAESVGCMHRMHAATVDYARQRKQFGVPIATFQVLQHRLADMFVALEQSSAITQVATLKLDAPPAERARAASAAKVRVARAARFVGQSAIQTHGGMGITEELALGHYFRRTTAIAAQLGSVDHHVRRYADLSLAA